MKKVFNFLTLIILIALIAVAAVWFLLKNDGTPGIQNVIIISIDTCRADHLSCYGYPEKITPNIDAFAGEACLFKNTVSPVPITLPAHCSLLTGTIPPYNGVHSNVAYQLAPSNITLAEILKSNGFQTAAIVSTFVLEKQFGLDQGFDMYDNEYRDVHPSRFGNERKGDEATNIALEYLGKKHDSKFFLFLHYYDPHLDYTPPEPFASKFPESPYAGEIAFTDHCIGRFIQKLKELDLYESALLIVVGDHGEMLGEHGEEDHGFFIYESAIKVPLIIKLPGTNKPKTYSKLVGLVDVVPTVCSALNIEPPAHLQGKDLMPILRGDASTEDRHIYSECLTPNQFGGNSLMSVSTDIYKYIQTTRSELYDLKKDPGETNNLIEKKPQHARILQDKLRQILQHAVRKDPNSKLAMDPETIKRLESLGYLAGKVDEEFTFDTDKEDPKDLIDFHVQFHLAKALVEKKQLDQATAVLEKLSSQRPTYVEIFFDLGTIAMHQHKYDQSAIYFEKYIKLKPDNKKVLSTLGKIRMTQGKVDQAINYFLSAMQLDPNDAAILNNLSRAHFEKGEYELAIKYGGMAVAAEPQNPGANFNLALAFEKQSVLEQALKYYIKTLEVSPDNARACNKIAFILFNQGKPDQAIGYCRRSLKINPNQLEMMHNLAQLQATNPQLPSANIQEAISLSELLCRITNNNNPVFMDTLAISYAAAGDFNKAIETAQKAINLANAQGNDRLAVQITSRLDLYKQNKPFQPGSQ